MIFYNVSYPHRIPRNAEFPCILLGNDSWNDFGYYTLFKLYYCNDMYNKVEIGFIKILEEDKYQTKLPLQFNELEDKFCSLGEGIEYYIKFREYFEDEALSILHSLNDCSINKQIYNIFKDKEGFKKSLLRTSDNEKGLEEGQFIVKGLAKIFNAKFKFSCHLLNATSDHSLDFNFDLEDIIPNRLYCIIGKNGTGKTQILSKIALGLSGQDSELRNCFYPGRPLFSKVIAVSYSIFDEFEKPDSTKFFNYIYIGNRLDKNTILSQEQTNRLLFESLQKILEIPNKKDFFKELISNVFSEDLYITIINFYEEDKDYRTLFANLNLSSGQNVIFNFIVRVLSEIVEDSLILFDEPEIHLHPNAISKIIYSIYQLLNYTKSYSIIATHSPIIVQQIPSKYIKIFDRIDNTPIIRDLNIESFGENLNSITENIFMNKNEEDYYRIVFENLYEEKRLSLNALKEHFNNDLNYNALMFYRSLENEEA